MDRRSNRSSGSTRQSTRSSASNVFGDQHALPVFDNESAQTSPTMVSSQNDHELQHQDGAGTRRSSITSHSSPQDPPDNTISRDQTSQHSSYQRPFASRFSFARNRNSASEATSPATNRRSTYSSFRVSRAESPYQGATGPSQPYGMYLQNTGLSRAASTATTSTMRQPERSYTGPRGPTQPYGLYPQNTTAGDEENASSVQNDVSTGAYPVGSRPPPQPYQRRLGPEGEDIDDIVGPDGYAEQLPPYTRYANDIPPKRDPHATRSFYGPATPNQTSSGDSSTLNAGEIRDNERAPPENDHNTTSHPIIQLPTQNPAHSPLRDPFGDYPTPVSSTTTQVEALQKEEKESFTQRAHRSYKKRVCWGVLPCWLLSLVVTFLVAIMIGGVLGGVLAHRDGVKKGVETAMQATASPSHLTASPSIVTTSILPGETPDDAAPIPTPTQLPIIPTGTWAVSLQEPLSSSNSCLTNPAQNNAWDCSNGADLEIDIQMPSSGQMAPPIINLTYSNLPNQQIRYGAQPPELVGLTDLVLARDKSKSAFNQGPAYSFNQQFNKTVIVKAEDFPGPVLPSKRDSVWSVRRWLEGWEEYASLSERQLQQSDWNQTYLARPGDKPWYCFWNGTVFSGFIYTQNEDDSSDSDSDSDSSSSSSASPTGSYPKRQVPISSYPQYPKTIKIKEKRNAVNPTAPYCQQVQVLDDFRLGPALNTVLLTEYEATIPLHNDVVGGGPSPHRSTSPKLPNNSTANGQRPEQSTFAISITLLTPGLNVPYSSPKPTQENPYPTPRKVSTLPGMSHDRGRYASSIAPYLPLTTSPNETIAAYIYFDGRPKEEVATLLRRGEETWVNSRWVSVPTSEGGGLAEREFLFREVGLERWLNGLDLDGKDAAATIEKRRQKMEKKRRRRKIKVEESDGEEGESSILGARIKAEKGVLRYGADSQSPLEQISDSDDLLLSESEDSDDDPVPESTGQIKVALYRVLASGDIRRGEYSPQFDAHEGDEMEGTGNDQGKGEEDIDHQTSFAKPKSLDPKSISTQTVTGIDPQDKPFAVFTFLYRGEKQLHKMGMLPTASKPTPKTPVSNGKRRSIQDDLSKFKPLDSDRLKNFSQMRDPTETNGESNKKSTIKREQDFDSDDEHDNGDAIVVKAEKAGERDADAMLSPEEAKRHGELADGVQNIRLKRQHSADSFVAPSPAPANRKTPTDSTTPVRGVSPTKGNSTRPHINTSESTPSSHNNGPLLPSVAFNDSGPAPSTTTAANSVGSPLKKARSSLSGIDDEDMRKRFGLGIGMSGIPQADVLGRMEHDRMANAGEGSNASSGVGNVGPSLGGILGGVLGKPAEVQPSKREPEATVKKEAVEEMEEEL
ncbi:uncharacterized protein KY384_000730 [Bacidia gigantensis]|uniref:uncharacterized protein n=1 Tax=Bacidia gigantensis TaxID=2732470 RepID=UPI001D0383FE|nr:uncharacterized protein KY384_000730 [Bacidia gigantensis]KAG8525968.1 hypothetical protein KY384_000730 [Bacidia gigantensis]